MIKTQNEKKNKKYLPVDVFDVKLIPPPILLPNVRSTDTERNSPFGLSASIGIILRSIDLARLFDRPKRRFNVPKKSRFLRWRPRSPLSDSAVVLFASG